MAKSERGRQQAKRRREREKSAKRRAGSNPFQLAGERGDLIACMVNEDWKEGGMASLFVARRMPDGAVGMSAFLIDIWCMGLKDAWGRLDMTTDEFRDVLTSHPDLVFEEIDFAAAHRLVSGSIRFARENGFRLPRRYERWTLLAGIRARDDAGANDDELQDFRRDGKLVYMGPIEDLGRRLTGQSLEDFLTRDDLLFAVGVDGERGLTNSNELIEELGESVALEPDDEVDDIDPVDDDLEDQFEDSLDECRQGVIDGVRRWCFSNGIEPHPRLADAWALQELALFGARSDTPSDAEIETMQDSIAAFLDRQPPEDREPLAEALAQIGDFISQFESQDEMLAAVGFADEQPDTASSQR